MSPKFSRHSNLTLFSHLGHTENEHDCSTTEVDSSIEAIELGSPKQKTSPNKGIDNPPSAPKKRKIPKRKRGLSIYPPFRNFTVNGANSKMVAAITGKTIREEATEDSRTFDAVAAIRVTRLKWFGCILRMDDGEKRGEETVCQPPGG